jgi:hypothetical protein
MSLIRQIRLFRNQHGQLLVSGHPGLCRQRAARNKRNLRINGFDGGQRMTRERLPNRRHHQSFAFEHAGIRYVVGIGRFDNGQLAEVFVNGAKSGTDADTAAKDGTIVASLAPQDRVPCEVIRHGVTRNRDGTESSPRSVVGVHQLVKCAYVFVKDNTFIQVGWKMTQPPNAAGEG